MPGTLFHPPPTAVASWAVVGGGVILLLGGEGHAVPQATAGPVGAVAPAGLDDLLGGLHLGTGNGGASSTTTTCAAAAAAAASTDMFGGLDVAAAPAQRETPPPFLLPPPPLLSHPGAPGLVAGVWGSAFGVVVLVICVVGCLQMIVFCGFWVCVVSFSL